MKTPCDNDSKIAERRKQLRKFRLTVILSTLIIVGCCVIVIVKKEEHRAAESRRQELLHQAEYEAMQLRRQEEEERRAEELRRLNEEALRRQDSLAALPKVEEPEPKYTWDDVENMVMDLTDENYYASIWWDEKNIPTCVVIYTKGGKQYFRRFNPEKRTYGQKVRVIKDATGNYHASGNKRDRYVYDRGGDLIHEVNGKEKERFINHRLIDVYTPEPAPEGYEDWEDYFYDNEEDLREYYR